MSSKNGKAKDDLSSLGEFGLIQRLTQHTHIHHHQTRKGIGDDAAVIGADGKLILLSTDMLLEGVHFDLSYVPLKHLGYKAMVVNISDIVAMNGTATQATVGIAVGNRWGVRDLEELYAGIHRACANYKIDLCGGDTTTSRGGLVISVTMMGFAANDRIVYRSGAKKGDILCVTGDLGGAYAGLKILEREKAAFSENHGAQPVLDDKAYIIERQIKPEARADLVRTLQSLDIIPTSMIDISDGLASELLHIAQSSGVGIRIFEEKLPIAEETYRTAFDEFNISPIVCALNGGEDYEILFSIDQKDHKKLEGISGISFIGYVQDASEGNSLITLDDQAIPLQAQGWKHF